MRVKLTITYDGSEFCGWQIQPNGITVQQTIEEAIEKVTGEKVRVTGSGRTDAGVHATGQVAHFDTNSSVPPHKFFKALNIVLPPAVKVVASEKADDDFHACASAKRKTYEYSLYVSESELPLKERYAVRLDRTPDVDKMNECAKLFIGEHDFKGFSASGCSAKTTVRTIYDLTVIKTGNDVIISVTGNGFLYNMVRILSGTLVKVGYGEMTADDVNEMLKTGERSLGGKTLPPKGLCLKQVEY